MDCIRNSLIVTDRVMDCSPLSPVNNLVNLFEKCFVLPCLDEEAIGTNRYFTHLSDKSFSRCILLVLLPFVGGVAFAIYDAVKKNSLDDLEPVIEEWGSYPWGMNPEPEELPEGWTKHVVENKPLKYPDFETPDAPPTTKTIAVGATYYRKNGVLVVLRTFESSSEMRMLPWEGGDEPAVDAYPEGWEKHTAAELTRVNYGGDIVWIPGGANYYTYNNKIVIGWHGSYNPPTDMDGHA